MALKILLKKIDDKPDECGKDFMKIKFNPDGNLTINNTLKLHNVTIIVISVFQDDKK